MGCFENTTIENENNFISSTIKHKNIFEASVISSKYNFIESLIECGVVETTTFWTIHTGDIMTDHLGQKFTFAG